MPAKFPVYTAFESGESEKEIEEEVGEKTFLRLLFYIISRSIDHKVLVLRSSMIPETNHDRSMISIYLFIFLLFFYIDEYYFVRFRGGMQTTR